MEGSPLRMRQGNGLRGLEVGKIGRGFCIWMEIGVGKHGWDWPRVCLQGPRSWGEGGRELEFSSFGVLFEESNVLS